MASATELKDRGNARFSAGDFEGAIALYTQAIELAPPGTAILFSNRANAYLKCEEFGAALEDGAKAIELDPRFPKGYYRRGTAHFALGQKKAALQDFRRAMQLVPGSAEARAKVQEVERILRREAFEAAIASAREQPVWEDAEAALRERFDVPSDYDGPRLSRPPTLAEIGALVDAFRAEKKLHPRYAFTAALDALEVLRRAPTLVDVDVPDGTGITVVGDLHGQFYDLLRIFERNGPPSESNPYLFNGDFVDRGSFSCEVVLTLLAYKVALPNAVFLNRGNHETLNMNRMYGFEGEAKAKFGELWFELMTELFCHLPLAHVLARKVFVVHGGLMCPPDLAPPSLDEIRKVNRVRQPPEDGGLMSELLWSDPQPLPGRTPSKRGVGFAFGPDVTAKFLAKNSLTFVVRSHEVKPEGYEVEHGGRLATVFSAANYVDRMANKGAFVKFTAPAMQPRYETFEAAPHPNVPPMAYSPMGMGSLASDKPDTPQQQLCNSLLGGKKKEKERERKGTLA